MTASMNGLRRGEERPRVLGRDRPGLQPRPDVGEACGAQALRRLAGAGEVPRARPACERRMVDARDRLCDVGHVARAAALGDELAARLQRGVEAGEQPLVVVDPVEGGGAQDRVDGLVELEVQQVDGERLDAVAEAPPGLVDHRLRAVDRHHVAVRHPLQQQGGHPPGAAAGVEDPLVAAQVEPLQDVAAPRLLGRGDPVVRGGVPFAWRHTCVRYLIRPLP
jgi:hypothetical protein